MPGCSKAVNPRGVEITFTEYNHKYSSIINGKEIEYISGTTFIGKFFPPFDPTGDITRACARKRGITVEAMRNEWRKKSNESCIFGTRTHEICEDVLLGRKLRNEPMDFREKFTFPTAEKVARELKKRCDILGVEKIIFDEHLKIAGTIDVLMRSRKNGDIIIGDWKTNGDLDMENRYNSFALDPIPNIPNTKYSHYNIQLSLYEYLLREVGYIDKNEKVSRCIFHITENGYNIYMLEDLSKEIKTMIDFYKNGGLNR